MHSMSTYHSLCLEPPPPPSEEGGSEKGLIQVTCSQGTLSPAPTGFSRAPAHGGCLCLRPLPLQEGKCQLCCRRLAIAVD